MDAPLHKRYRETYFRRGRQHAVDLAAAADEYGTPGNYVNGANIAGFMKVANAMRAQGLV